jgi:purine nucleosidase
MANSIPVLLDTDIGSDIDDAVALAYLLQQPRCELLGVTTVTGDVSKRAACAEVICRAAGRTDVPIHCGASNVLLIGPGQPHVPHYQAIRKRLHQTSWPANTAVEFLRQTIRKRPGEIIATRWAIEQQALRGAQPCSGKRVPSSIFLRHSLKDLTCLRPND